MIAETSEFPPICLERYTPYVGRVRQGFLLDPPSTELRPTDRPCPQLNGWLFDQETDIRTRRRICIPLFKYRNALYLWLGDQAVPVKDGRLSLAHRRGCLWSSLDIKLADAELARYVYLRPWWRAFLDDGMFPEDRFPLEVLSRICRGDEVHDVILERLKNVD